MCRWQVSAGTPRRARWRLRRASERPTSDPSSVSVSHACRCARPGLAPARALFVSLHGWFLKLWCAPRARGRRHRLGHLLADGARCHPRQRRRFDRACLRQCEHFLPRACELCHKVSGFSRGQARRLDDGDGSALVPDVGLRATAAAERGCRAPGVTGLANTQGLEIKACHSKIPALPPAGQPRRAARGTQHSR